jgi:hypothetical protein
MYDVADFVHFFNSKMSAPWKYPVKRRIAVPTLVNILVLLAIPVYITAAFILVLAGGEYENISATGTQNTYDNNVTLWYQRFIPGHAFRTVNAWDCEPNTISAGDRKLPLLQFLTSEFITNVTNMNTYQIEAIDQSNGDVSNHMKYANYPLTDCSIYQINLIPPVDPAESTAAKVSLACCVMLTLGIYQL